MTSRRVAGKPISTKSVSEILRTVPMKDAFHFFTDIGQFSGKSATSLVDFAEDLKTVPLKSIEFHSKRGDFERWIRETLGDDYLANGISKIGKSIQGEKLRTSITRTVDDRLNYLEQS